MKLRRGEIEHIAGRIVGQLIEKNLLDVDEPEAAVAIVIDIITKDLMIEDRLNDEVRQLLEQYSEEVQRGGVEYHRMFNMVKAKLVRERNIIL